MGLPQPPSMYPRALAIVTATTNESDHQVQIHVQIAIVPHDVTGQHVHSSVLLHYSVNLYHYSHIYLQAYRPTVVHLDVWFHGPTALHPSGVPLQPLSPFRALRACRCFVPILQTFHSDQKEPQLDPISIIFWGLLPSSMVQSVRGLTFPKHNPQLLISFSYCGGRLSQQKDSPLFAFSRGRDIL